VIAIQLSLGVFVGTLILAVVLVVIILRDKRWSPARGVALVRLRRGRGRV